MWFYTNTFTGLITPAFFVQTNAVCPLPQSGGAFLWNSNNTFYKVTKTGTNFAF
jgi:hypothetical protein